MQLQSPIAQFPSWFRIDRATSADLAKLDPVQTSLALSCLEARDDFWSFRKYLRPKMKTGWFLKVMSDRLQQFYEDFEDGKRPKLAIIAPRQHGKSWQAVDFIAWLAGKNPDLATIFASYSERLGRRANLWLQRIIESDRYRLVFPGTTLGSGLSSYQRNSELIEFVDREGSFRNTTVAGKINGESLHFGYIDDAIKGREEANSELIRDKTWEWLTDDFWGCFQDNAGMLVQGTRWHVDDPIGRMIERMPGLEVVRYPAVAEEDEEYRDKGEALFPELKSLPFLDERRKTLTQSGWLSIYQGTPIQAGGGMFPIEKFQITEHIPYGDIRRTIRYWDMAASEGSGDYTAGVRMHETKAGQIFVSSVVRGQWNALKRQEIMKQTAKIDKESFSNVKIVVEQEPGSGGKEQAEATIRLLRGYSVTADKVTGKDSKNTRADPYAAYVQAGNVSLLADDYWNRPFLNEHELFPNGKHDDTVAAAAGAFAKLTLGPRYNSDLSSWVGGPG